MLNFDHLEEAELKGTTTEEEEEEEIRHVQRWASGKTSYQRIKLLYHVCTAHYQNICGAIAVFAVIVVVTVLLSLHM